MTALSICRFQTIKPHNVGSNLTCVCGSADTSSLITAAQPTVRPRESPTTRAIAKRIKGPRRRIFRTDAIPLLASKPTITPSTIVPGEPMTISDGGGCGENGGNLQNVMIVVYNTEEGGPGFVFTVVPANSEGHWEPITLNSPLGPKVSWNVSFSCTVAVSGHDLSQYLSATTVVPVS